MVYLQKNINPQVVRQVVKMNSIDTIGRTIDSDEVFLEYRASY